MVASKLNVGLSSSIDGMLFKFQLVLVVIVNIDVSIVKKFKQTPHLAGCVAGEGGEGYDKRRRRSWRRMDSAQQLPTRFFLEWISLFS